MKKVRAFVFHFHLIITFAFDNIRVIFIKNKNVDLE